MSHLRNLFHKSGHQDAPAPMVSATAVRDHHYTAPAATSAIVALPEFPVEEARLSPESRLAYYADPRGRAAERFRLLRMRLKEHWTAGKLKKLLVTGALSHDGKSTIVLNLATALSERGKRSVLVVEADLHHSSLSQILRLKPLAGLTECLTDESTSPLSLIRRIEPLEWCFLAGGEPRRNPTELLQTPIFGGIMQKLSPHFDWILVDSPPVMPLTDSLSLQQHTDATLLVVRAGHTPREAVEQTIALLGKQNVLGVVLNDVEIANNSYYQYYEGNRSQSED